MTRSLRSGVRNTAEDGNDDKSDAPVFLLASTAIEAPRKTCQRYGAIGQCLRHPIALADGLCFDVAFTQHQSHLPFDQRCHSEKRHPLGIGNLLKQTFGHVNFRAHFGHAMRSHNRMTNFNIGRV